MTAVFLVKVGGDYFEGPAGPTLLSAPDPGDAYSNEQRLACQFTDRELAKRVAARVGGRVVTLRLPAEQRERIANTLRGVHMHLSAFGSRLADPAGTLADLATQLDGYNLPPLRGTEQRS